MAQNPEENNYALLLKTVDFAAKAHRLQRRKNSEVESEKTPYINHPVDVALKLAEAEVKDLAILQAGLLHDTIEDTKTTYDDLVANFGVNVANIVRECTDNKSDPKIKRKQDQIVHAGHASVAAQLVKSADKLSNLSDLHLAPPPRWSKAEIDGYFIWSYHVWLAARGNNDKLDSQLHDIFAARGITEMSPQKLAEALAAYYNNINKSE